MIPMPDGLADAEESSDMRRALAYALYSTDPDMEFARTVFSEKLSPRERYRADDAWESLVASGIDRSEQESLSKSAAQYARNLSEHGHLTWYTWAYANWNTKWNAYESSLCGRTISFTTAWCAPTPVFEAMIARYPDVPMSMSWYEEQGIENTGEIVSDGKGNVWYYQGGQSERAAGIYARLTGAEHVLYDTDRLVAYQEEDFEDDPEYFEEEGISREDMEKVEPAEVGAAAKGLYGLPFKAEHFEVDKRLFPR